MSSGGARGVSASPLFAQTVLPRSIVADDSPFPLSPCVLFSSRKADIELGEGGHFGELNLLTGRPSIANVTVLTPKARLMAVTKKDYKKR